MAKRTINASEIGAFLYCQRAWWYRRQGIEPENLEALAGGTRLHNEHSRKVVLAGALRALGWLLLLAGLMILALLATLSLL
jgi:CRISPR/Cas system-associated exonuclease Cas4 (RecB family)